MFINRIPWLNDRFVSYCYLVCKFDSCAVRSAYDIGGAGEVAHREGAKPQKSAPARAREARPRAESKSLA